MLLLAMAWAACSKNGAPPVIQAFTVSNANPEAGAPVSFAYAVSGATSVSILPEPGAVTSSPVTVVPSDSGPFTLQASNSGGTVTRDLRVTLRPFAIDSTEASPGQVAPGGDVTLSWRITSATRATLTDGSSGAVSDVPVRGFLLVHPAATTVYTLTAYNRPGHTPETLTATIPARVTGPPAVGAFTATPSSITQGDSSLLQWSGNATAYAVSDGSTSVSLGPRLDLLVRPSVTTTYTLKASGPAGSVFAPPVTVTVDPHPGSTLSYTPPAGGALQLLADPCANPCTSITLRIKTSAPVQLRGLALDLPLDATKAHFAGATFSLAGAVSQAAMGSGPLQDALVLGLALRGDGTAPAADVSLGAGAELASVALTLLPAGGRGTVFDGSALAAGSAPAYKASVQSASGRAAKAIAVGKLEAQ
jgi:hypothetical protein